MCYLYFFGKTPGTSQQTSSERLNIEEDITHGHMLHEVYKLYGGKKVLPIGSISMELSARSFTSVSPINSLQTGKGRTKSLTSVPHVFPDSILQHQLEEEDTSHVNIYAPKPWQFNTKS